MLPCPASALQPRGQPPRNKDHQSAWSPPLSGWGQLGVWWSVVPPHRHSIWGQMVCPLVVHGPSGKGMSSAWELGPHVSWVTWREGTLGHPKAAG